MIQPLPHFTPTRVSKTSFSKAPCLRFEATRLIISKDNYLDSEAVRQLEEVAKRDGIIDAVGLPDIHPGPGMPVGAAYSSRTKIYGDVIGNDSGCGMGVYDLGIPVSKLKLDKAEKKLAGLESEWDGDIPEALEKRGVKLTHYDDSLGTIGGGNHFAEIQKVEEVLDAQAFAQMGLSPKQLYSLIHSGSRGLGEGLYQRLVAPAKGKGFDVDSAEAKAFLTEHENAVKWAHANRAVLAQRLAEQLGGEASEVSNNCHNGIEAIPSLDSDLESNPLYIHRKGAAAANHGPFMIAGSRGDFSYLVEPTGDGQKNLFSLAHGAGRKWKRGDGKSKLSRNFSPEDLRRTALGGRVICEDRTMIYDEAPNAYKSIEQVVKDLVDEGLIKIIAKFRPLLTYKKRNVGEAPD